MWGHVHVWTCGISSAQAKEPTKERPQPTPSSCTVIGVHAVPGDGSAVLIDAGGARGIRIGDRATRLALAPLAPLASLGLVTNSLDRANTARLPGVSAHERFGGPGLRHHPRLLAAQRAPEGEYSLHAEQGEAPEQYMP